MPDEGVPLPAQAELERKTERGGRREREWRSEGGRKKVVRVTRGFLNFLFCVKTPFFLFFSHFCFSLFH